MSHLMESPPPTSLRWNSRPGAPFLSRASLPIYGGGGRSRGARVSACVRAQGSAFSYRKFVDFAVDETRRHAHLVPAPLQNKFGTMKALDEKTELAMLSYEAPKVRLLRSLSIEGSDGMQVLDFAVLPKPDYDLPIFCANFFSSSKTNIVVLDLNPVYNVVENDDYKEKCYENLLPLSLKYAELLPWGGKLTGESLKFFSPIVIWTRFNSSQYMHDTLFSAFKDYLKAWLLLMDLGEKETDASRITANREAQHRYLTWRAEKDPGYQLLKRCIGETQAKNVVRNFLFDGVDTLGSKSFLDYFPEYQRDDGTINDKRSMVGKSFGTRPWNSKGEFIGSN